MLSKPIYAIRYIFRLLTNLLRRIGKVPDYVVFTLEGEYSELPQPAGNLIMRQLRPPRISLQELTEQFRTVAGDPRVRGVILHLRPLAMPLAQLDALRDVIAELRAAGKRVVAWSYIYDTATYYLACAADEILLLPGGTIAPLGLHRQYTFIADVLERVGVKADVVQITPYKTAADMFNRSDMSDEARAMANWLADAAYDEIARAIADGRKIDTDTAKVMIDKTPCTDLKAKEMGVVDGLLCEDDLLAHLQDGDQPARLVPWDAARGRLFRRPLAHPGKYVALMSIEGMIVDGSSQRPPIEPPLPLPFVFDERAGDMSVVQAARQILSDKRAAAVVVYVDSGGGSSTASESMRLALEKIAAQKPLVVVMGPVAASGGYWVAMPGKMILAQPNTITGSIGVLGGKFADVGLIEKLLVKQESISRGKNAQMYMPEEPFSDEERALVWENIQRTYDLFLERVAAGRGMERDAVDAIGGGRVWTGRQALENGLVDELGGLEQAFVKARQLAGLHERAPVRMFVPEKQYLPPVPEPAAALKYALDGLSVFNRGVPFCVCPLIWD